jgi:hypothetical protein
MSSFASMLSPETRWIASAWQLLVSVPSLAQVKTVWTRMPLGCCPLSGKSLPGTVWFPVIITWFPLIVTRWLRQPPNGLEALDTMRGNRGDDDGKPYRDSQL